MKIFKNKTKLLKEISNIKDMSFVPTMGSIHKGHLSLIKKAKKKSNNILVSIYINPKQFSSDADFHKYPRNINKDIDLLKKIKVKYLYLPTYKDIYSFNPKSPIYLDKFSKKLCGKLYTSHFRGVINVVNRFVEIIKPASIFLGLKDFQQLALIRIHLRKNKIPTKIISCPIIRRNNGLAFSSRNVRLQKNQVALAGKIYKYLKNNKKDIFFKILENKKKNIIKKIKLFGVKKVDYLECINIDTLGKTKVINENYNIFISYYLGKTRLIDNL